MVLEVIRDWIGSMVGHEDPEQERELIKAEQHLSELDRALAREQIRRERQRRDGDAQ